MGRNKRFSKLDRRTLLKAGLLGLGAGSAATPFSLFAQNNGSISTRGENEGKILVVLELSGGNDGLNTLVPYGDDAYYRHRPNLGIRQQRLRIIDDHFGFNPGMSGFERLYKDGNLAVVHGCGYENPSFSHFTSMAYWHTAAPNSGADYGWVGRLADAMAPEAPANFLVNIDSRQSLAVRSAGHVPVVFDNPGRFTQEKFFEQRNVLNAPVEIPETSNASRRFLLDMARSAQEASALVRDAWSAYETPIDYGINGLDLPEIAALIDADMPTRLYYTSYRNNAFDTHVFQENLHQRILTYTSDALSAFFADLERIGRADDVVVMVFSEFGRRVPENVNQGTDHGAANLMFVAGKSVKGGHYGELPSLINLDEGDNLIYTTDFRRVYATMMSGWLGVQSTDAVLRGNYQPFDMFV